MLNKKKHQVPHFSPQENSWHEKKEGFGKDEGGKKNKRGLKIRPWWDSNPQSPAPEADALSIRPQGLTPTRVTKYGLYIPQLAASYHKVLGFCNIPGGH